MLKRVRSWERSNRQSLLEHPLFDLYEDEVSAGADTRSVLVVDPPDWVNVIPLLDDRYVLMVRQWRHGVGRSTLEIPGGMVERAEGEGAPQAAARELVEETGHRAHRWRRLGVLHPNPAFMTNRISTWLATDLERVSEPGDPLGVGSEELELEVVPLGSVPRLISTGEISHSLVVAAFYLQQVHA